MCPALDVDAFKLELFDRGRMREVRWLNLKRRGVAIEHATRDAAKLVIMFRDHLLLAAARGLARWGHVTASERILAPERVSGNQRSLGGRNA